MKYTVWTRSKARYAPTTGNHYWVVPLGIIQVDCGRPLPSRFVNNSFSKVNKAVPQGSILGPSLFPEYLNDIITRASLFFFWWIFLPCSTIWTPGTGYTRAEPKIHADDTTLYSSKRSIQKLQEGHRPNLDHVGIWLTSNHVAVNNKTLNNSTADWYLLTIITLKITKLN